MQFFGNFLLLKKAINIFIKNFLNIIYISKKKKLVKTKTIKICN